MTALQQDCSFSAGTIPDRVVYRSERTAIGEFRCPVQHPRFRDSGPTSDSIVVFPRTSVWIRHEGSTRFLADPTIATIYNRAQVYERLPSSVQGDRCDWFAVDDELAREIAATFEPSAVDSPRPFRFEWARTTASLYYRQRAVLSAAKSGALDALSADEAVMQIVADVLALAHGSEPLPPAGSKAEFRRAALVHEARAELARSAHLNQSVSDIARSLGVSPYHLCRIFRESTGMTMGDYRMDLRVRFALEMVESRGRKSNLSAIAHEAGFASHSHFVAAMKARMGLVPREIRALLA